MKDGDGNVLWLSYWKWSKRKIWRRYDPWSNQYFVKDCPYYTGFTGYNYPLPVIVRRYSEPYQDVTKSAPEENVPSLYKCGLCEESLDSENELDKDMDIERHQKKLPYISILYIQAMNLTIIFWKINK